jgi:gliding motility-associated lipoprotein GldD
MKYHSLFAVHCSLLACLLLAACTDYSPKPSGYYRIDLPEPAYHPTESKDFTFNISDQSTIRDLPVKGKERFFNIVYAKLGAQIYCSYIPIKKENLMQLSEESRKFVYLHAVKADAIHEQVFENQEQKVFGIRYSIQGNVASPTQFVLTDSVGSFFRGALYFDNTPNQDSIAPVLEYINNDIQALIESFRWKK